MLLPYKTSGPYCIPDALRFATQDTGQCREYIWSATGTHRFDLARAATLRDFHHYERRIGGISVSLVSMECSEGFRIAKTGAAAYYSFQFPQEGSNCELEGLFGRCVVGPGHVFILDPGQRTREFWPAHCLQYIVRVERRLLEQTMADEIRREIKRPLVFDPVARDPGIAAWLRHIFSTPQCDPAATDPPLLANRRVVRSLERALLTMLIAGLRHNESQELDQHSTGASPYYVRRAEEYIRANARADLTVEDIAAAAHVSPRSIFYGFQRWRNTTPMAHVRQLRLELARKELEKARREGGTVSQAALNAGFTNFSQFSKLYKKRFGETPSTTLRMS